jgi:protoporphyrinogen IX oxidase
MSAFAALQSWLADAYPWTKAFHIMSIIAWLAGMFYLPRLYVYHADAPPGSALSETFKVMERRLLRAIINPAMAASFLFGTLLALTPGIVDWSDLWIWGKLALVAALALTHHRLARWRKAFAADRNTRPARFYRMVNEVPTALMIGIVLLVVLKPF